MKLVEASSIELRKRKKERERERERISIHQSGDIVDDS